MKAIRRLIFFCLCKRRIYKTIGPTYSFNDHLEHVPGVRIGAHFTLPSLRVVVRVAAIANFVLKKFANKTYDTTKRLIIEYIVFV